ncbi:MAG: FtsQ-type POTRA domain-containing protein [Actinomycetota bacterium]
MSLFRRKKSDDPAVDVPFASGDVRVIPIDRPDVGESAETAGVEGVDPDIAVLDELSEAFADEPTHVVAPTGTSAGASAGASAAGDDDATPERVTISIGGDEDLPDAVYLDDGLGDGSSGTVFIDDDDRGDAVHPHEAAGPGIEPRLRQRRIGVRRAEARGRLKWVALGLVVVVLVIGVLAVLGSGLFAVDRVDVTGRQYADEAAVEAVVDDLRGTPVLLVDTAAAEEQLELIPWVDAARVSADFPDRATIELRERVPLAAAPGPDGRFRILDREGRVLQIEDGQPVSPVLITSPLPADLQPGAFADVGHAAAASIVTKLTPEVRDRLDSIEVTADGSDMVLRLRGPGDPISVPGDGSAEIEVRLGAAIGDNDQIEKLVRLERVLDDLAASDATIVDVSTGETTLR